MILMIDDVKMVNADMFYPYVSKALAHDMDSIANGDKLYEKLCEVEEPLEVMIYFNPRMFIISSGMADNARPLAMTTRMPFESAFSNIFFV